MTSSTPTPIRLLAAAEGAARALRDIADVMLARYTDELEKAEQQQRVVQRFGSPPLPVVTSPEAFGDTPCGGCGAFAGTHYPECREASA